MQLTEALGLARAGRFVDAFRTLEGDALPTAEKLGADILKISLLERLGHYSRSRFLAEKALRAKALTPVYQSDCRFVLGLIDWDEGRFDRALEQFQRARELARTAGDAERACWIQLRLMVVQCGRVSTAAAAPWISQTRHEVTRLGVPMASAALHVLVGEVAVRHGALETGRRHTLLGLKLLEATPNAWLRALAENCLVALAIIESDVETGLQHAMAASAAAELSGAMTVRRACLGNLGILHALQGALDRHATATAAPPPNCTLTANTTTPFSKASPGSISWKDGSTRPASVSTRSMAGCTPRPTRRCTRIAILS